MRLSTKGRYGIHAIFDLAEHARDGAPQSLKAVAQRQNIPEAYLEQLLGKLRKADLVEGVRGAQGGYRLKGAPEEITVGRVLRALEGEMHFADCLMDEDACAKADACPTRLVWQKIQDGLKGIVDGITLADMLTDRDRLSETKRGDGR